MSHPISALFRPSFLAKRAALFGRDENGSLTLFTLVLFLLMVMMGGFAIDLMKYEQTRTQLQNTLDRCTLMAASLDQKLTPQNVVTDCVTKSGLGAALNKITVVEAMNSRDVTAQGLADTKPFFLHLLGINDFDAKAVSAAQQGISNVEIALVLDVSGSMRGTKIASLKTAANEFVATMLSKDTNHRTSIGLVPYNGQVNLGADLRAMFTTTDNPGVANMNCVDLPSSVYNQSAMSTSLAMPMTGNVDTFSYYDQYAEGSMPAGYAAPDVSWTKPVADNRWCPPSAGNVVRPMNNSISALQGNINGLQAVGATSINAGFKWGLSLLDPASRGLITSLAGRGVVPSSVIGRPFDYDDPDTMKVIIVMTDGKHFAEERMNPGYRSGPSPIYRSSTGEYSRFDATRAGTRKFWVPSTGRWETTAAGGAGAVPQTWQQLWANQNAAWVAWQLYARSNSTSFTTQINDFKTTMNQIRTRTATSDMNAQLQKICSEAKTKGVIVYGIAFEAEAEGQDQIAKCASSDKHYFNAEGLEIATAFRTIASNLSQLKLTQ